MEQRPFRQESIVDEERMRPDHRSELMLCVPFSAVALMVGRLEGHPARENPVPVKKVKVKASHTRCRALGPELILVYRQSACR